MAQGGVPFYYTHQRKAVLDLVAAIKAERPMHLHPVEGLQLFEAVRGCSKIPGDIAEVGVFKGGSAKIICEARGVSEKQLHLFDTFEGLPTPGAHDPEKFRKGAFLSSLEDVRKFLSSYRGVSCYKGLFPETAGPIRSHTFSFVHLDVDLYESTLSALQFFYNRMNSGGVIISHDYQSAAGVKKAFDEFFSDKPEFVIELAISQCLVVKT